MKNTIIIITVALSLSLLAYLYHLEKTLHTFIREIKQKAVVVETSDGDMIDAALVSETGAIKIYVETRRWKNPDEGKIGDLYSEYDTDLTPTELLPKVLGGPHDKDVESILSKIVSIADYIVVTKSSNERACEPSELKKIIGKLGYKNEMFVKKQIPDAIEYAKSIAKKDDLICITGSLFTVGEGRDHLF